MVQGGGAWNMVQPRHPRARARDPGGGPGRGGEGVGAGERGAAAEARGRADRPQGERAGGGRGGREGAQGRGPQPGLPPESVYRKIVGIPTISRNRYFYQVVVVGTVYSSS